MHFLKFSALSVYVLSNNEPGELLAVSAVVKGGALRVYIT